MKDEIKEAIDNFNGVVKGIYRMDEAELEIKDIKILLDYITNLQEKYDIAQKDIEAMKHNYNLLVRLIENGESMTRKFVNGLSYQDYKSRNEKAIEFIEHENFKRTLLGFSKNKYLKNIQKELLNILNGGDE